MTQTVRGRRRGAPRKSPEATRSIRVKVNLTPGEFAQLQASAARSGQSKALGRHLVARAFGRHPTVIPAINRAAWSHLGKWAGAFSTIANAAAGERLTLLYPHLNPSLMVLLDQVRAELRSLRLALLGQDEGLWTLQETLRELPDEQTDTEDRPDDGEGAPPL